MMVNNGFYTMVNNTGLRYVLVYNGIYNEYIMRYDDITDIYKNTGWWFGTIDPLIIVNVN